MKRNFIPCSFLLLTGILHFSTPIQAGSRYVNGATGSDITGNGSLSSPYATIQAGINAAAAGDTIHIAAGTYPEHVAVSNYKTLIGSGISTIIEGPVAPPSETISINGGATVLDLTVTRAGNNLTDWNDEDNKSTGVQFGYAGGTLKHCRVTGNRNGVYINTVSNVVVEECDIDFNRTGFQIRGTVNNILVRGNNIRNNWTMGVLFLDYTAPPGTMIITRNNITGNWYAQIENRTTLTDAVNMTGNWLGNSTVSTTALPAGEPGYNIHIPSAYGGSAIAPGSAYMVAGTAAAMVDYTAWLPDGTDHDLVTPGFQHPVPKVDVYDGDIMPVATPSVFLGNTSIPDASGSHRLNLAASLVDSLGTVNLVDNSIIYTAYPLKPQQSFTLDAAAGSMINLGDWTMDTLHKTVTLAKDVTVNGTLQLNKGIIKTAGHTLSIPAAQLSIAVPYKKHAFIDGTFTVTDVQADIVFPAGSNGRAGYIGLKNVTGNGTFTITHHKTVSPDSIHFSATPALHRLSGSEYWDLHRVSGNTAGFVQLYVLDTVFSLGPRADYTGSFTGTDVAVAHFDQGSNTWETLSNDNITETSGNTLIIGAGTISNSFSPFTFGFPENSILPVHIISFTGREYRSTAILQWQVAGEDILYYEVEKSTDGNHFSSIGMVPVMAGKALSKTYSYTDPYLTGNAFYRLKMAENDQQHHYSSTIRIAAAGPVRSSIKVYPSPVRDQLHVVISGIVSPNCSVTLSDISGRTLYTGHSGTQEQIIDMQLLQTGLYFLSFTDGQYHETIPVSKL